MYCKKGIEIQRSEQLVFRMTTKDDYFEIIHRLLFSNAVKQLPYCPPIYCLRRSETLTKLSVVEDRVEGGL